MKKLLLIVVLILNACEQRHPCQDFINQMEPVMKIGLGCFHIVDSLKKENDSLKVVIDKYPMFDDTPRINSDIFYDNTYPFIEDSSVKIKKRKWLIERTPLDTIVIDDRIYVRTHSTYKLLK